MDPSIAADLVTFVEETLKRPAPRSLSVTSGSGLLARTFGPKTELRPRMRAGQDKSFLQVLLVVADGLDRVVGLGVSLLQPFAADARLDRAGAFLAD